MAWALAAAVVPPAALVDEVRNMSTPPPSYHLIPSFPPGKLGLKPHFSAALFGSPHDPELQQRRVQWYTPKLITTHSYPSKSGPCPTPYGTRLLNPPKRPKARAHFLAEARRLLREASATKGNATRLSSRKAKPQNTFKVRFRWRGPAKRSVVLTGSFKQSGDSTAMKRIALSNGENAWECVVRLRVGKYRYRYLVDGEWRIDHSTLADVVDGVAVANLVIVQPMEPELPNNRMAGT